MTNYEIKTNPEFNSTEITFDGKPSESAYICKGDTAKVQDSRKANRKKKLVIETIKGWLTCGNIKKAVDIAEKHNITPEEFGKIAKEV